MRAKGEGVGEGGERRQGGRKTVCGRECMREGTERERGGRERGR